MRGLGRRQEKNEGDPRFWANFRPGPNPGVPETARSRFREITGVVTSEGVNPGGIRYNNLLLTGVNHVGKCGFNERHTRLDLHPVWGASTGDQPLPISVPSKGGAFFCVREINSKKLKINLVEFF
jgi:hypothetical protein